MAYRLITFIRKCIRPTKRSKVLFYGVGLGAIFSVFHFVDLCKFSTSSWIVRSVYGQIYCSTSRDDPENESIKDLVSSRLNERAVKYASPQHKVSIVHCNSLDSNSPGEDRHVLGYDLSSDSSFFAVVDGHGGVNCAEVVKHNLIQHVAKKLGDFQLKVVDPDQLEDFGILEETDLPAPPPLSDGNISSIKSKLKAGFVILDDAISDRALADVRAIAQGHSLSADMRVRIMQAVNGACALLSYVRGADLFVSSTGDCRAVVGRRNGREWQAMQLSEDQQVNNLEEMKRLYADHPNERDTIVSNGRLLGSLMPLRSFGDVPLKWKKKDLSAVNLMTSPFYYTPPYLTAEPVVTHLHLSSDDRFVVIASDGLWERLGNQQVVDLVGKHLDKELERDTSNWFWSKSSQAPLDANAATALIRKALGESDDNVHKLLSIPAPMSRNFRDDITIIVAFFKR